ncbi:hypothetical protein KEM52_001688, partial [Ascosphaera acerosa]
MSSSSSSSNSSSSTAGDAAAPAPFSSYLVTPAELAAALAAEAEAGGTSRPRTIPLCATWYMPNDPAGRTGRAAFARARIAGARFFDVDAVRDADSPYPHMLPTAEVFEAAMQRLGIRRDDRVVVYDADDVGLFSAPRVGWTLRVFGHEKVHVLNNFKLWVKEGYPVETGEPAAEEEAVPEKSTYTVSSMTPELVVNFAEMKQIAARNLELEEASRREEERQTEAAQKTEKGEQEGEKEEKDAGETTQSKLPEYQILDARPYVRWAGTQPEPRPELPSGHMPGSTSVPFGELLDPATQTLLPRDRLRQVLASKGVREGVPAVSSCGSGVTAAL